MLTFFIASCDSLNNRDSDTNTTKNFNTNTNSLTAFQIKDSIGVINEATHSINVVMPYTTDLSQPLVATFVTDGKNVAVRKQTQKSGISKQLFMAPVTYIIAAQNGATKSYLVTVKLALNSDKAISLFKISNSIGAINESNHSINVVLPYGTDLSEPLTTTFISSGSNLTVAGQKQTSGESRQVFNHQVIYKVAAANGSTQEYTVVARVAKESDKAITAFKINSSIGVINPKDHSIKVTMPYGSDLTQLLKATFVATGSEVTVAKHRQSPEGSYQVFNRSVIYKVIAADGSSQNYTVSVVNGPRLDQAITSFNIGSVVGSINEATKVITVVLKSGTSLTNLIATFTTINNQHLKVQGKRQDSGDTSNDFSHDVYYDVFGDDGIVTQRYTVKVRDADAAEARVTSFSINGINGVLNDINRTIKVTLPAGTDLQQLKAKFSIIGNDFYIDGQKQYTFETPVANFSNPLKYDICSANGKCYGGSITVTAPRLAVAYILNSTNNTISTYSINQITGVLSSVPEAQIGTGQHPVKAVITHGGRFLYVTNQFSHDISAYVINPRNGTLKQMSGSPFAVGTDGTSAPYGIAIDPTDTYAYVTDSSTNVTYVYTINQNTGKLNNSSKMITGNNPHGIVVDPNNLSENNFSTIYIANTGSNTLSEFDGSTLDILHNPITANGINPVAITIDPSGKFVYMVNSSSDNLTAFSVNSNGLLTQVSGSPFMTARNPIAIAIDPTSRFVYVINKFANNISAYTMNQTTGLLKEIPGSPFAAGATPSNVALDPTGKFIYVTNTNSISVYNIDNLSGVLTALPGSPFTIGGQNTDAIILNWIQ